MNEKELLKIISNVSDEVFIKVIRQSKKRIQKIEKKEKQAIIDEKFKQKGITHARGFLMISFVFS